MYKGSTTVLVNSTISISSYSLSTQDNDCHSVLATIFGIFVGGMVLAQSLSVLCNRSAVEIRRYGRPTGFPTASKLTLIAAVCGRGPRVFHVSRLTLSLLVTSLRM